MGQDKTWLPILLTHGVGTVTGVLFNKMKRLLQTLFKSYVHSSLGIL